MKLPEFLNYIRVCRYFCQTNFFKLNKAVTYDEFDMIDIPEDESDSDDADYFDELMMKLTISQTQLSFNFLNFHFST